MSNIQITQTETPNIVVTVDRGVAGVGIESVTIVYQDPLYYLEFTYTNGTTELVPLPAIATGVVSFNTRIGVVTLTSNDVTDALLANSIANSKLVNSSITINGAVISLGGSVNVGTVTSVAASAGTGISVTGSPITTSGTLVVTNTAPDQVVSLTGAGTTSITGTYPNFTITSNDVFTGDVTGAASSTDNAVARYNGTTGKVIQNSSVIIDDSNNVSGVATLNASNLIIADNSTLGSSNTDTVAVNGRITTDLDPNTNNANDVGTNGRNWRDGFFGRTLSTVNLSVTGTTSFDGSQGTSGQLLTSAGTGNTPTWSALNLATQVTGTLPPANGGTGITSLGAGVATFLGTPTSANLAAAVTNETGTGALVFGTSPTLTTPTITGGTVNPTTLQENGSPVVVQTDIGTAPNEIPLNQYLGSMAYQDRTAVNIGGGAGAFTTLTSTSDATINGVRVGRGGGSVATNTAVGASAINATATGASNTGVGYRALTANTSGAENTALGQDSLFTSSTGGLNSAVGFMSLYSVTTASSNTAVGHQAGFLITTGAKNTILGRYNGNQGGLDIRTLSNYVVLSDGDGNPRLYHNGTTIVIPSLPTSSAGLPTGGLWNDGGTLKVA